MTVYLVGAGPGDPGLITVRGAELLGRADVVLYDRLSVVSLLDLAPPAAERISVGKTPRGPSTPQYDINRMLIEFGRSGRTVVRLKGGDPFVFARGGEEAAALAAAGVPFEVVPGITSAIAAPAYAGVPVTYRGLATSFTVVTGHEDPWAATETDWDSVARLGGTIVVLMGVGTRAEIAKRLIHGGLSPDTPVVAVVWGTRPNQETVRTTLAGLGDAAVGATATIVIGQVAGLGVELDWFARRPLFGRTIVVTRAQAQAGGLRTRLEELGANVLEVPTIRIRPPADGGAALAGAVGSLATFDWVAFTSANAVDATVVRVRDARAFGAARVAAIGPGTEAALARFGVVADVVADQSVAEGLVAALPSGPGRVLVPQASDARAALADGLREKGWTVTTVEAYRTEPADIPDDVEELIRDADAIAFTSSSTVTNFVAALGADAVPPVVVCMGQVTAATAVEAGLEVAATADPHTLAGLVDAIVQALARPD